MGTTKILWRCIDCGFFAHPEYDQDSGKKQCQHAVVQILKNHGFLKDK
jgi:hypothetical protein